MPSCISIRPRVRGRTRCFFFLFITLGLELSDTKVYDLKYEPSSEPLLVSASSTGGPFPFPPSTVGNRRGGHVLRSDPIDISCGLPRHFQWSLLTFPAVFRWQMSFLTFAAVWRRWFLTCAAGRAGAGCGRRRAPHTARVCRVPPPNPPRNFVTCASSSLLLSSLELSDTQSLWALNTSPPRNRCTFL